MIEGLKIDVPSDELIEHLKERADYHTEKSKFYTGQVEALRQGGVGASPVSNDPVTSLESSAKSHQDRAAFFNFLDEHVVLDETYRLSEQDLTRLEIVSRYF